MGMEITTMWLVNKSANFNSCCCNDNSAAVHPVSSSFTPVGFVRRSVTKGTLKYYSKYHFELNLGITGIRSISIFSCIALPGLQKKSWYCMFLQIHCETVAPSISHIALSSLSFTSSFWLLLFFIYFLLAKSDHKSQVDLDSCVIHNDSTQIWENRPLV